MGTTKITARPDTPQIVIVRDFDAPRDLVYRAYTDPELLVRWMGPLHQKMTVERMDLHDGGTWRYLHRTDDGHEFGFHGVYHGSPSPDLFVRTFEFEGAPGHVSLETATFTERDGRTEVRVNALFQAVEDRDATIESGMERGMNEGFTRLDDLLSTVTSVG